MSQPVVGGLGAVDFARAPLPIRAGFRGAILSDAPPPGGIYGAYVVRERVLKKGNAHLFLVSPVVRAPTLTHDQFDAHWRDVHAPLALTHHVGMCDYRQLTVDEVVQGPPFDGISILGFSDETGLRHGLIDSAEGERALGLDVRAFLDLKRTELQIMRRG